MPDPVTNIDVEDVLSSIRRLVSEEKRPQPGNAQSSEDTSSGSGASEELEAAQDALVLTPALRVSESDTADDADLTAAPVEPVEGMDTAPEVLSLGEFARVDVDEAPAVEGTYSVEVPEPLPPSGAAAPYDMPASEEEIAEAAQHATNDRIPADDDPHYAAASALEGKIAALEAVIAARRDQWEPDGTSDDPLSGTETPTLAWEDSEEVDADPELDRYPAPSLQVEADDVIDEEALRDLVAEIVRQELQGSLGERITRNVRKLVRREIHRALAARDLE